MISAEWLWKMRLPYFNILIKIVTGGFQWHGRRRSGNISTCSRTRNKQFKCTNCIATKSNQSVCQHRYRANIAQHFRTSHIHTRWINLSFHFQTIEISINWMAFKSRGYCVTMHGNSLIWMQIIRISSDQLIEFNMTYLSRIVEKLINLHNRILYNRSFFYISRCTVHICVSNKTQNKIT